MWRFWLIAILVLESIVWGQWEANGEIISDTGYLIDGELIIPDEDNGAIVFWKDHHAGYSAIYAQKVDSAGYQLWEPGGSFIGLTTMTYSTQVAVSDGDGGAVVAWSNYRINYSDIYAQRIGRNGELLWGDSGIAVTNFPDEEWAVNIVADGYGGYIIVWQGDELGWDRFKIQRLDAAGAKLFSENGIYLIDDYYGGSNSPILIKTGDSTFACVWNDLREGGLGPGIYAQKFDLTGNILWDPEGKAIVYGPTARISSLKIATDLVGGFYCAWQNYYDYDYKIKLQHTDSTGNSNFGMGGLEISTGTRNGQPYLSVNNSNSALITWVDDWNDQLLCNIVNSNGDIRWPGGLLVFNDPMGVRSIVNSIPSEFEIAFDALDPPRKRVQKITDEGNLLYPEEGIGFGLSDERASRMKVVTDSLGGSIIFTRTGDTGPLRIHRIYSNGHVGGDTLTSIAEPGDLLPTKLEITSNYPNPFNSRTTIEYNLPYQTDVSLIVYNMLGQIVKSEGFMDLSPGHYSFSIQLANQASGVYFIRIQTADGFTATKRIVMLK